MLDEGRFVAVHRAMHVEEHSDEPIALCRDAVAGDNGLVHVAHYTRGIYDFAIERRDDDRTGDAQAAATEARRTVGRQVNFTTGRLEEMLRPLQSGRLIRAVLDFGSGAVYYFTTRQGEYLVGICLDGERTARADQAMAGLATGIRALHRLGPENPGGFLAAKAGSAAAPYGGPYVHDSMDLDKGHREMARLCLEAIRPADLHYVAHHHGGDLGFQVDVLEHPDLRVFFRGIAPKKRRTLYQEIGQQLVPYRWRLDRQVHDLTGGQLDRLVLDVEEGALYYHRLVDEEFLLGVTVDQEKVNKADQRIVDLLAAVRENNGHI